MKKKKKDEEKFVVYNTKLGRSPVGIYCRHVMIAGDSAFVLPQDTGRQADIVPKENVFNTHLEAEKYLAGSGVKRWVVGELNIGSGRRKNRQGEVPVMFEALVVRYNYGGRFRREDRLAITRISDGQAIEQVHRFLAYGTKKEAETAYAQKWRVRMKDAKEYFVSYRELINELEKNPPRSKRRKINELSRTGSSLDDN